MRKKELSALPLGLAAGIAFLAWPVSAQDKPNCNDPQTQYEMTYCAGIDFEQADEELNELWPEIVAAAKLNDEAAADFPGFSDGPTTVQILRGAQRAWITFRDAQCEYEGYAAFGGTLQPMLVNLCLARLTEERIVLLKQNIEGFQ